MFVKKAGINRLNKADFAKYLTSVELMSRMQEIIKVPGASADCRVLSLKLLVQSYIKNTAERIKH